MKENFVRNIFYYKRYYLDFFNSLDDKVKEKFNWTLKLILTLEYVPKKYFSILKIQLGFMKLELK